MDYFAGLDISMEETRVCVLDREGVVVYEGKAASMSEAIADELAKAPSCRRIVFETGRMGPVLFHGLSQLGLPVVCVESRQAYQARRAARSDPAPSTASEPSYRNDSPSNCQPWPSANRDAMGGQNEAGEGLFGRVDRRSDCHPLSRVSY